MFWKDWNQALYQYFFKNPIIFLRNIELTKTPLYVSVYRERFSLAFSLSDSEVLLWLVYYQPYGTERGFFRGAYGWHDRSNTEFFLP